SLYWSTRNNWEYDCGDKNQKNKSIPPAYHRYTRLIAETELISLGIFLLMIVLPIVDCYRIWKTQPNPQLKIVALILFTSMTGLLVNWLQVDFFKQYGFWLCLAVLIKLMVDIKNQQQQLQQQA